MSNGERMTARHVLQLMNGRENTPAGVSSVILLLSGHLMEHGAPGLNDENFHQCGHLTVLTG